MTPFDILRKISHEVGDVLLYRPAVAQNPHSHRYGVINDSNGDTLDLDELMEDLRAGEEGRYENAVLGLRVGRMGVQLLRES